jgi:hypothetical protein
MRAPGGVFRTSSVISCSWTADKHAGGGACRECRVGMSNDGVSTAAADEKRHRPSRATRERMQLLVILVDVDSSCFYGCCASWLTSDV